MTLSVAFHIVLCVASCRVSIISRSVFIRDHIVEFFTFTSDLQSKKKPSVCCGYCVYVRTTFLLSVPKTLQIRIIEQRTKY